MPRFPLRAAVLSIALAAGGAAALAVPSAAIAAPSQADTAFITANGQTDQAEIALGQLALTRAQSSQARDLATQTLADHQKALAQLTAVAQPLGVAVPAAPSPQQQAQAAALQSAPAASFDLMYVQVQIAGHQQSIADTNTEIASGSDPTVVAYATAYLPVAQMHLTMAQAASSALGGTPTTVPAGTGGQAATTSAGTRAAEFAGAGVGAALLLGAASLMLRRRRSLA
jgi:putative membrane protein